MKKSRFQKISTAAALAIGVLSAPCATAAVDMFLKLADIKGESQDVKHKEEIDVLSWSWGMSQSSASPNARARLTAAACIEDINITKLVDKATAPIIMASAVGKHLDQARLVVRADGSDLNGAAVEYLVIDMRNLLVSSYSTGSSGGEDRLTEDITLNFEELKVTYTEQSEDGSPVNEFTVTVEGSKGGCN